MQRMLSVTQETRRYADGLTAVIDDPAAATIGGVTTIATVQRARQRGWLVANQRIVKVHQDPGSLWVCSQLMAVVTRTSRSPS